MPPAPGIKSVALSLRPSILPRGPIPDSSLPTLRASRNSGLAVARPLYDEVYCQQGEAENRIKEQQLGLFADRTSCHDFVANQFRVLLSAAAYVLVDTLRREGLVGTELANAQVGTIRLKLLKIGARVVSSVRRIVFHLAGGYPLKDLFARILGRLSELSVKSIAFG